MSETEGMVMANRQGVLVLDREQWGQGARGGTVRLAPGEYPFTVMDGDTDIATLGDPARPEVLIARLPLSFGAEVRE